MKEVFKSYKKWYPKIYVHSALHMAAFLNQHVAEDEKGCFMSQNLTPATAGIPASLQVLDKSRSHGSSGYFTLSKSHVREKPFIQQMSSSYLPLIFI